MSEFDINAMPQFDAMIGAVNQQHNENSEYNDPRLVTFKTGNSYRFRLCWPVDPFGRRQSPWIFRVTHSDFGPGRTNTEVTCPTSDYILGKRGFRSCKACDCSGEFYNDFKKTGSQTSEELYKHFKRNFRYIAMVYVVSDSLTPENNGKFMLIRVTKGIADYLNRRIFGWATTNGELPLSADRVMGKNAFLFDSGYDLVIDVKTEQTATGNYNSYSSEFMPQPTAVPVTQADCNKAALEMKFDEEFYQLFDSEATEKFVKEAIMGLKMEYEINGVPADFDPSKLDQGNVKAAAPKSAVSANPNVGMGAKPAVNAAPAAAPASPAATPVTAGGTFQVGGTAELDSVLSELGIK